jgi:hypothetical protein
VAVMLLDSPAGTLRLRYVYTLLPTAILDSSRLLKHLKIARTAIVLIAIAVRAVSAADDAVDRLAPERLEAAHQAVLKLKSERRELQRTGALREYRANLHVHSAFSHDSRGKIEEIVAAAKAAGTQILMFTEHPAENYGIFEDGHQGMRDGVLLVPGAEMKGMLVYPRQSMRGFDGSTSQELSDVVCGRDGLTFLSHLEERMDWELRGLTGVEIYNTHADFKDEKQLISSMRNPLWLLQAAESFRKYPQEAFSALQDYPSDYLRRWDELCRIAPHTGVSANDAHQNIGLVARLAEDGKVRVEDALGEKLIELSTAVFGAIRPVPSEAKVGDVLFQIRLDPYENSLRHVGTHLLMPELSREAVWEALREGRAFVAFDWIADATGFQLEMRTENELYEMGSHLKLADGLAIHGQSPHPGHWKLIQDGKVLSDSTGDAFERRITAPGIYRVEVSLNLVGEERTWVLSNPFYVTDD